MVFQCYTPRAALRSSSIGGLFISVKGARQVIPDQWLMQAELLQESRFMRLSYTFCTVEIMGQHLDPIFDDAVVGKLGTIQPAQSQAATSGQPWVTSIVVSMRPAAPEEVFEVGCFDA